MLGQSTSPTDRFCDCDTRDRDRSARISAGAGGSLCFVGTWACCSSSNDFDLSKLEQNHWRFSLPSFANTVCETEIVTASGYALLHVTRILLLTDVGCSVQEFIKRNNQGQSRKPGAPGFRGCQIRWSGLKVSTHCDSLYPFV